MDPLPDLTGIPEPGSVVAEKYRLERLLGAGGMGVVISARHVLLDQHVAIKFLLPAAARLHGSSARFLREAKAAAAITSEHVARVLDMGTLPNGAPYLVMEHLSGADLGRLVKTRGPLPPAEAVDLVLQAGEAIAEAHALGIVHRDLKLGNLFLTHRADGSPLVKVLDFGLSKTVVADEASESSLTATNVVLGSPYYMSPEQIRSLKTVDARADIWALGVILYVMLSGRRPFAGETASAICASVAADAPPALLTVRADLHPGLDAVITRCLEKDVTRRFQHLGELAAAMAPFASPAGATSVERIIRVLPITNAPVVMLPQAPPAPMVAPAAPYPTQAEPTVALPAMTGDVSQSQAQPQPPQQPTLPAVGDASGAVPSLTQSVQMAPGPAEPPAGEVGVTWAEPRPEAPPSRRRGVAAAIAGGAGLGALGLGILVWAAARPVPAPAPSAIAVPSPASPPPPAALPTAEPTPTASAPADTAPSAEPPPAPASAAPASTAPTRKPPGGRKPKDPLLDRWK